MAQPKPASKADEVTILVFKENQAARTFQLSLNWIQRFGTLVGLLIGVTLLSAFFAIKYYRVARHTDPTHVNNIEQELSQLRTTNKTLEAKISQAAVAVTAPIATPAAPPVASAPPVIVSAPPAQAPAVIAPGGSIPLFSALPRQARNLSEGAAKLPFTVSPAKLTWTGKSLRVAFNLQYTATDEGSQQGRIIVLARGPETVLAYPNGVFSRAGAESLIGPKQGEYFSVSRFREVKAEFGQLKNASQILDVEILIVSLEGELIFYQKVVAPKVVTPKELPKPAAKEAAKPKTQNPVSSEIIEPGVDQ
ncbi:hypothetical protein WDW37_17010 [Bdellovibrionota bacterium FG-1]